MSWKEFLTVQKREEANERMTTSLQQSMVYMKERMAPDSSFDVVYRVIEVGGRQGVYLFYRRVLQG